MKGKKILIVEDEGIPALELKQQLEGMGCKVVGTATTGISAVQTASETRPDAVLMDIKLKGDMDGIEAARMIQENMDIPVIYLTAYSDEGTLERARQTRLYWILQKPYFFDAIRSILEEAMERPTEH